jgi:iron complex transport system substrate-binding protein
MIQRRYSVLSLLLMAALLLGLGACSAREGQERAGAISLSDGLGRTVGLPAAAQRVVSLAPSNTEILFAIGAGSQLVGREEFSDYPAEAKALPSVGGSMGEYSTEAILALAPDLVLAAEINSPELVSALEGLGLTVYYLPNPSTLEEMYLNLQTVAQLTGREEQAAALIASLKQRVDAVDQKIAATSERPVVFYEIDATDPGKPYTYGRGTFGDLLIQRAGGVSIGSAIQDPYPQVSLEQIVVSAPEMILLGDAQFGITIESVKTRAGWDELPAVLNDQIFPFDDNLVSRPGPRLVDGLEALARLLHPEVFK